MPNKTTLIECHDRLRQQALLDTIYDAIESQLTVCGVSDVSMMM